MKKYIRKIKKVVDNVYFILIGIGFLAIIAFHPIMLVIIGAFILFRIYVNDLYETEISNYTYRMSAKETELNLKFEKDLKEIKDKLHAEKISPEFKEKLIKRLNEELNDTK